MLSPNAEKLLEQRYYKEGENWKKLVERNVGNIMVGDYSAKLKDVYELMYSRVFLPNSPSLVNAGTNTSGLFACFTVGPEEDTLENSFDSLTDIALVAKKGGGCGFSGSVLRPKDSPVAGSAHGYAYGPNRFAKLVSFAMDAITQSGFRKMALMYTLDCEHPDIEEFIFLKQTEDDTDLYNFNQSVMASDVWMNKALSTQGGKEEKLFHTLAEHACNNGEPAFLFKDTINRFTPYKYSGQNIITTNPCG